MTDEQLRPSIYISSMRAAAAVMLGLFGISQVDAVSVLGTLSRDNGAVPDDQSAAVAVGSTGSGGEWGSVGRSGRERDGFTEGRHRISARGLTDIAGNVSSFTPVCSGCR